MQVVMQVVTHLLTVEPSDARCENRIADDGRGGKRRKAEKLKFWPQVTRNAQKGRKWRVWDRKGVEKLQIDCGACPISAFCFACVMPCGSGEIPGGWGRRCGKTYSLFFYPRISANGRLVWIFFNAKESFINKVHSLCGLMA